MTVSVGTLRDRLATKEASLGNLRSRVKSAREAATKPAVKSGISAIQARYLSAVAQLETKEKEIPKPVVRSATDAVSSLASRWNKGMDGKKVEKTAVDVRGDVHAAKKNFTARDVPSIAKPAQQAERKKDADPGPAEIIVEDDSGVPSWAKNQQKLVIRKENARSSIRDVDVREIQGSVLENGARDGSEAERTKVAVGGNVKAALAMWGKTAEEDARLLALKKEEERKKAAAEEKARKEREAEENEKAIEAATAKFSGMQLSDLTSEPEEEIELIAFLERKIALVEKEIKEAEVELEKLEDSQ